MNLSENEGFIFYVKLLQLMWLTRQTHCFIQIIKIYIIKYNDI